MAVAPVNDGPAAAADMAATHEDEPVAIDALANDSDPDGDPLRVASVTRPARGTVSVAPDGTLMYAPDPDFHGVDGFEYAAADPDGLTATATVTVAVAPVNDGPRALSAIPGQLFDEGGDGAVVELSGYFEDVDGDALSYRAATSDADVATARVDGSALTLAPVAYGSAAVTVTAEDGGGLEAARTFAVVVDDRPVRAALDGALASMARSHLASARMTLGRRAAPGGGGDRRGTRLTVAGRAVPTSRAAFERMLRGWLPDAARAGSLAGAGVRPRGAPSSWAAAGAGLPAGGVSAGGLGMPGGGPAAPGGRPAVSGASPADAEFQLAFGEGGDGRWAVWGQGDLQTFRGESPESPRGAGHEGDLRTAYLGVDARLGGRWLVGAAAARSTGGGDWRTGSAAGRVATSMTAIHPYARWSDGTTSVWTMAGAGRGEAENARAATGGVGESDLRLRMGLVEVRRRVGGTDNGRSFGLRADAAWAELSTGAGPESIDGRRGAVHQQRVGVDLSFAFRLGGASLAPFGELHVRRDGGDGANGTGLEAVAGLRARAGVLSAVAQGRVLAPHSDAAYRERGFGVTLTAEGEGRDGERLSFSLSPRWGHAASGTGALWQEQVYRGAAADPFAERWTVDARLEYARTLRRGAALTLSVGHSQFLGFEAGLRIGGPASAAAAGRRPAGGGSEPVPALR